MHENAFFFMFLLHFVVVSVIMYISIIRFKNKGEKRRMGTYNIPRNVKGEGRILFVFSGKSMIYSAIGAGVGLPFYLIFSSFKMNMVGIIIMSVLALIGFVIGTFKFPEFAGIKFTKTVGGENIDDIIKRAVKFKTKGRKLYLYTKEEEKNG